MRRLRFIVLVLIGGSSFGILSTFVKLAYSKGHSLADVTSAQAYFGAAFLWTMLLIYHLFKLIRPKPQTRRRARVSTRTVLQLILTGMCSGAISLCYYKCVEQMPASIAIILMMQYTWVSILLERIVFRIPITPRKWLFVGIVLVGTVLGSGLIGYHGEIRFSVQSVVYGFVAGCLYAVFVLANGYVGKALPAIEKSSWVILGVCIMIMTVFTPFAKISALAGTGQLLSYFIDLLPLGLLLGVFGMVIPPLSFAYAIPRVGVALSSILGSIELPTATFCAYWLLQESVSGWQLTGIVLILGAIIMVNLSKKTVRYDRV